MATIVGLIIERVAVRPLKGNQWTTAVATVGAAFFFENIIAFITRPTPQDFPRPIESVTFYEIAARIEISNLQIVLVLISVGLMMVVVGFLRFTSLGISIRVVGQSPEIAKSVGIDMQRVVMWTFAISSAIGGAAGIINSVAYSSTYPYMGTFLGLKGIVILIVAGVGNMRGALVVGLISRAPRILRCDPRQPQLPRHCRVWRSRVDPGVSPRRPVWGSRTCIALRFDQRMTAAFAVDLATDYGIVLVMALGLHVMMLCGQVSLGHGGVVGIGAYAGAVMTANLGFPYVVALVLSGVAGGITGFLIANLLAVRISGLYLAIGTFAIGQALITAWINIDYVGGGIGFTQIPMLTKWPAVFIVLPIVIFAIYRLELSRFGYGFRTVAADEVLAAAMGTNVKRIKVMAWTMGCSITAIGGALHAHRVSVITPAEFGFFVIAADSLGADPRRYPQLSRHGRRCVHRMGDAMGAVFLPARIALGTLRRAIRHHDGLPPARFAWNDTRLRSGQP